MTQTINRKAFIIILIIALLLFAGRFFSFVNWNNNWGGWLSYFVYGGILIIYILNIGKFKRRNINFKKIILGLAFVPFFTILTSYAEFGQSPLDSFKALFLNFLWLFYFILHKYRVSEKVLLKIMLWYAITILLIQVIQQFTYPFALFGIYSKKQQEVLSMNLNVDIRNGLYRFRIMGSYFFSIIILFFYWSKIQSKFSLYYLFFIFCCLISIYLNLTRQIWATVSLTLILSYFISKNGKLKVITFLWLLFFIFILLNFYDVLFSTITQQTKDDASDDNIRLLCIAFYWKKIISNIFTFTFGYGVPFSSGPFYSQMTTWTEVKNFYTSDIGFLGQWFHFGLAYLTFYILILYRILIKYKNYIPDYIKLFVIATFFLSPMIFSYANSFGYLVWTFILYISDLHINKSPLRISR